MVIKMVIKYQSPNYKPERVTNRYLHVDISTDEVIISETEKMTKTNYTIRSYVLPKEEHEQYLKAITEAEKIKMCFPYSVEI
jgi:hypothetical protein